MRKFHFLKYKEFFRGFRFLNYKKRFILIKYKKYFPAWAEKFHLPKCRSFLRVSVTWNITKFPFLKYEENSLSEYIRAFFCFLNLGLKVHQLTIVAKRFVIYCWQYSENYRVLNVFFPKYQKTLKLFWEHLTNIFRAGLLKKKDNKFF